MDFGKNADYMALGYVVTVILLLGMTAWIYLRYRALRREQEMIEQIAQEEQIERASAVASKASGALDPGATPIVRDMSAPSLREET
jgi:hypothetical protein